LKDTIATAWQMTGVGTAIGIFFITVVAILNAQANQAITALGGYAARDTGIVICVIAIVASLKTQFAFGEVVTHHTVTTSGTNTVGQASIMLDQVGIIALLKPVALRVFHNPKNTVTTAG
tara:strand:+ start:974 stop:1333 length:360 start_codon:yes stop_codon:yes gene_type:complete